MKTSVWFSFDDLNILSAIIESFSSKEDEDDFVILRGNVEDVEDKKEKITINDVYEPEECMIYLCRDLFYEALGEWLDTKAEYYRLTEGGFAGVGEVYLDDFEEFKYENSEDRPYLQDWNEETEEMEEKQVRDFFGHSVSVEMEGG